MAGNRLKHVRQVFNHTRHRPAVIQGPTEWSEAVTADAAIGPFEPGEAAEGGWVTNRARSVFAERTAGGYFLDFTPNREVAARYLQKWLEPKKND